jgi:hypothetical protein
MMTLEELEHAVAHLEKLAIKLLAAQTREQAEGLRSACIRYREEIGYYSGGPPGVGNVGEQITKLRAAAALYLTSPIDRHYATSELSIAIYQLNSAVRALRSSTGRRSPH